MGWLEFLSKLAWPITTIACVACVLFIKNPLKELLYRIQRVGYKDATVDFSSQAMQQIMDKDIGKFPQEDQPTRYNDIVKVTKYSSVDDIERRITTFVSSQQINREETVSIYIRLTAFFQMATEFERIIGILMGGQFQIMQLIKQHEIGMITIEVAQKIYHSKKPLFGPTVDDYPFESYIGFLSSQNLIQINDLSIVITPHGNDFLDYVRFTGRDTYLLGHPR